MNDITSQFSHDYCLRDISLRSPSRNFDLAFSERQIVDHGVYWNSDSNCTVRILLECLLSVTVQRCIGSIQNEPRSQSVRPRGTLRSTWTEADGTFRAYARGSFVPKKEKRIQSPRRIKLLELDANGEPFTEEHASQELHEMWIRVFAQTSAPPTDPRRGNLEAIRVELMSEDQILFFYVCDITSQEFVTLKRDQQITCDFRTFTDTLVDIFGKCRAEPDEYHCTFSYTCDAESVVSSSIKRVLDPLPISACTANYQGKKSLLTSPVSKHKQKSRNLHSSRLAQRATLKLRHSIMHKTTELITLIFYPANEEETKFMVSNRYKALMNHVRLIQGRQ